MQKYLAKGSLHPVCERTIVLSLQFWLLLILHITSWFTSSVPGLMPRGAGQEWLGKLVMTINWRSYVESHTTSSSLWSKPYPLPIPERNTVGHFWEGVKVTYDCTTTPPTSIFCIYLYLIIDSRFSDITHCFWAPASEEKQLGTKVRVCLFRQNCFHLFSTVNSAHNIKDLTNKQIIIMSLKS